MGTRNLTIVILDGKPVVAQYCQWDGYPDGQGRTILKFLRDGFNRKKFIEGLSRTKPIPSTKAGQKQFDKLYEQVLGYIPGQMIDMQDSKKFALAYPSLGRDLGGRIIEFIQNGQIVIEEMDFSSNTFKTVKTTVKATDPMPLRLDPEFGKDTTWCEYIWTVDLDEGTFSGDDNSGHKHTWKLNRLPTIVAMLARFERDHEDDEG